MIRAIATAVAVLLGLTLPHPVMAQSADIATERMAIELERAVAAQDHHRTLRLLEQLKPVVPAADLGRLRLLEADAAHQSGHNARAFDVLVAFFRDEGLDGPLYPLALDLLARVEPAVTEAFEAGPPNTGAAQRLPDTDKGQSGNVAPDRGYEVYLTNNCPQSRNFIIAHYLDPKSGTWEWGQRNPSGDLRGTMTPKLGETRLLFSTKNQIFYINLHNQNLRDLTRDDIRFVVPTTVNNNMHGTRQPVRFQTVDLKTSDGPQSFRRVNLELTSACRLDVR